MVVRPNAWVKPRRKRRRDVVFAGGDRAQDLGEPARADALQDVTARPCPQRPLDGGHDAAHCRLEALGVVANPALVGRRDDVERVVRVPAAAHVGMGGRDHHVLVTIERAIAGLQALDHGQLQ